MILEASTLALSSRSKSTDDGGLYVPTCRMKLPRQLQLLRHHRPIVFHKKFQGEISSRSLILMKIEYVVG